MQMPKIVGTFTQQITDCITGFVLAVPQRVAQPWLIRRGRRRPRLKDSPKKLHSGNPNGGRSVF